MAIEIVIELSLLRSQWLVIVAKSNLESEVAWIERLVLAPGQNISSFMAGLGYCQRYRMLCQN